MLNLSDLKIKSFVTSVNAENLKGKGEPSSQISCVVCLGTIPDSEVGPTVWGEMGCESGPDHCVH